MDHAEWFHQQEFSGSDHRRYVHRLWEMYDNDHRPHQGLDGNHAVGALPSVPSESMPKPWVR